MIVHTKNLPVSNWHFICKSAVRAFRKYSVHSSKGFKKCSKGKKKKIKWLFLIRNLLIDEELKPYLFHYYQLKAQKLGDNLPDESLEIILNHVFWFSSTLIILKMWSNIIPHLAFLTLPMCYYTLHKDLIESWLIINKVLIINCYLIDKIIMRGHGLFTINRRKYNGRFLIHFFTILEAIFFCI